MTFIYSQIGFLYSQFFKRLPRPTGSYAGKTVIVTGSSSGLGKEAAKHYARLNAGRLILAVRNKEKGYATKEEILVSAPRYPPDSIEIWELDMARYESVKSFAARVRGPELDRVDVFIANAGVAAASWKIAERDEITITVNVVSTFLLALLVMPKLKETAARFPRIRPVFSIVSSEMHAYTDFPQRKAPSIFAALSEKTAKFDWGDRYNISKLLEILFVRALAERYPAEKLPVTVNCVNPGFCKSEFIHDHMNLKLALFTFFCARSTEAGSRTLVHGGSVGAESHGQHHHDCKIAPPSDFVLSAEGKKTQDRVWEELMAKVEAIEPGITDNL